MKISIDVEATAQEMREFLGLPDVQPLHEEMLQNIRENMKKGISGFDALTLMKPVLPGHVQSLETLQKAFWDAYTTPGGAVKKSPQEKPEK